MCQYFNSTYIIVYRNKTFDRECFKFKKNAFFEHPVDPVLENTNRVLGGLTIQQHGRGLNPLNLLELEVNELFILYGRRR